MIPFAGEIYYMIFYYLSLCKKPKVDPQPVNVNFDGYDIYSGSNYNNQTSSVSPHLKP